MAPSSMVEEVIATREMCFVCFDELIHVLSSRKEKPTQRTGSTTFAGSSRNLFASHSNVIRCPIFVTWNKEFVSKGKVQLRGCIGTLAAQPLNEELIRIYARKAAFEDRRFPPIHRKELLLHHHHNDDTASLLHVSVSLLVQYEDCHALDWKVGIHGIVIQFQIQGKSYSATFLPQVAQEQRWDQHTTLQQLIRKTGYTGDTNRIHPDHIQCQRYQSSKCQVSYQDYLQHCGRDSVSGILDHEINDKPSCSIT